eukprot:gene7954-5309_t
MPPALAAAVCACLAMPPALAAAVCKSPPAGPRAPRSEQAPDGGAGTHGEREAACDARDACGAAAWRCGAEPPCALLRDPCIPTA